MPSEYRPTGIFHDTLWRDGRVVLDRGWRGNLVVDRCRELLAAFLRGDKVVGIQQLLVGRGLREWDESPPDPPVRKDQRLVDPSPFAVSLLRTPISYLGVTGEPVAGPTPRLRIEVKLAAGQPPVRGSSDAYPLREFGLFGRVGRTDFMINYVRHPVIRKRATDTLVRTVELTL